MSSRVRAPRWLAVPVGLALGIVASVMAQQLSLPGVSWGLSDLAAFLPLHLLAGVAVALRWLVLPAGSRTKHALYAVTAWIVPFLAVALAAWPETPGRWLLFLYALSIPFDWVAARFLTPAAERRSARLDAWIKGVPHGPFIAGGMALLALVPLGLLANQQPAAGRLANWAFGFLGAGVLVAVVDRIPFPGRLKQGRFVPELGLLGVVACLLFSGYALDHTGISGAESIYVAALNPNYLAGRVKPGDVVISDSPDLDLGALPAIFPYLNVRPEASGERLWADLSRALQGKRKVFWVRVPGTATAPQSYLGTFLKANGCLDDMYGGDLPAWVYELRSPLENPQVLPAALAAGNENAFDPVDVDFGAFRITGWRYEREVCSHDAIAIALRWQSGQPASEPINVSFAVTNAQGRVVQTIDMPLQDADQRPAGRSSGALTTTGYYLVPIPFGTAPGEYTLSLAVYPANNPRRLPVKSAPAKTTRDSVALGTFQVYRAADLRADPFKTAGESGMLPAQAELQEGLVLDGYSVGSQSVIPGTDLDVAARWRAGRDHLPAMHFSARLTRNDRTIAQTSGGSASDAYSSDRWIADEPVLDRWSLAVPPDAAGGQARLEIGIDGGRMVYVADVDVVPVTRTYEIPTMGRKVQASFGNVATLVGYDLAHTEITAGAPLALVLHWKAASRADKDYAVFAQLIAADGHLVAQSDGAPAGGARPTRSWLAGEILRDVRELAFGDPNYRGDATLIVGLYDPATGERLPVQDGRDNAFTLPDHVRVVER